MFIKYAHLLTGVVRDDNVGDVWMFVIWEARGIADVRHSLFVKAKRDLNVLSLTHGALELHITRANYSA